MIKLIKGPTFTAIFLGSTITLIAGVAPPAFSQNLTVVCAGNNVIIPPNPMDPDEFIVNIVCGNGNQIQGTAKKVNNNPSDLVVLADFILQNPNQRTIDSTWTLGGYTLPLGPQVVAWHSISGNMNLQGAGAMAGLDVKDGSLIPGGDTCLDEVFPTVPMIDPNTGQPMRMGCLSTGFLPNGGFQEGPSTKITLNGQPNWTRSVDYLATFNNQAQVGSLVSLQGGTGNNPWVGVPEPTSTLSLLSLGILGAGATLKRKLK